MCYGTAAPQRASRNFANSTCDGGMQMSPRWPAHFELQDFLRVFSMLVSMLLKLVVNVEPGRPQGEHYSKQQPCQPTSMNMWGLLFFFYSRLFFLFPECRDPFFFSCPRNCTLLFLYSFNFILYPFICIPLCFMFTPIPHFLFLTVLFLFSTRFLLSSIFLYPYNAPIQPPMPPGPGSPLKRPNVSRP